MKPKIKKTKQPDVLEYDGDGFEIKTVDSLTKKGFYLMIRIPNVREIYLPIPQAKELSKVLPKFLEEMEKSGEVLEYGVQKYNKKEEKE